MLLCIIIIITIIILSINYYEFYSFLFLLTLFILTALIVSAASNQDGVAASEPPEKGSFTAPCRKAQERRLAHTWGLGFRVLGFRVYGFRGQERTLGFRV